MIVLKRDGRQVEFDRSKIFNAIYKAFEQLDKPSDEATQIKLQQGYPHYPYYA